MIANHPVKPTITSHPGALERIRLLPCGVALVLFLIAFVIPFPNQVSSAADVFDQARNICVGDAQTLGQEILLTEPNSQGPPISLGCKLRNCGPPSPIEMRIRLTGDLVVDSVRIEFTNLPPANEPLIKVTTGTAVTQARDGSVRIPQGQQVILQISPKLIKDGTFVNAKPAIKVTLLPDKFILQKVRGAPEVVQFHENNWTATLEIDQLKGPVVVNEFKALYRIKWCLSPQFQFDQIKLRGADSKLQRVGLVNGRSPFGCLTYKPFVGTDTLYIGNLLGPSTECPSNEIVVFSPDRAMYIGQLHPDWTDKSGDVREMQLPDKLLQLRVKFWILHKPENKTISTLTSDLQGELKLANQLFGPMNQCGIEFVATEDSFKDRTIEAEKKGLSGYTCDGKDETKFHETGWKDSGAINVYYVSDVTHGRGSHCGLGIFLSERRTPETLAHEIGHDLGLADALFEIDELTKRQLAGLGKEELINWGFAQENLMFSGGNTRTELTKGQCFRCYMNVSSKVRTLVKTLEPWGEPRDCVGPKSNCIDVGSIVTKPQ